MFIAGLIMGLILGCAIGIALSSLLIINKYDEDDLNEPENLEEEIEEIWLDEGVSLSDGW